MNEQLVDKILTYTMEYGIFAVLFLILFAFLGFLIWRFGLKLTDKTIETMETISSSNIKFAESSENLNELVSNLVEQNNNVGEYLRNINYEISKSKYISIELIEALKLINNDNPEIKIRLENAIKEIERIRSS